MITNRIFLVLFIFLVLQCSIQGQEKAFLDGNDWNVFPTEAKRGFLLGFEEGIKVVGMVGLGQQHITTSPESIEILERMKIWIDFFMGKTSRGTYEQLIEGIDKVYDHYANKHIEIFNVQRLVKMRINGELSEEEFQNSLMKRR